MHSLGGARALVFIMDPSPRPDFFRIAELLGVVHSWRIASSHRQKTHSFLLHVPLAQYTMPREPRPLDLSAGEPFFFFAGASRTIAIRSERRRMLSKMIQPITATDLLTLSKSGKKHNDSMRYNTPPIEALKNNQIIAGEATLQGYKRRSAWFSLAGVIREQMTSHCVSSTAKTPPTPLHG